MTGGAWRVGGSVLLTLLTTFSAHVDGGGRLPDTRSTVVLVAALALTWASQRRTNPGWWRTGLLLAQGQLIGHLAYSLPTTDPAAVVTRGPLYVNPATTAHVAAMHGHDMPGMDVAAMGHSSMAHMGHGSMVLSHATAVVVGLGLLAAVETLCWLVRWFLARLVGLVAAATLVVQALRPARPVVRQALWAAPLHSSHPRRGPPALA